MGAYYSAYAIIGVRIPRKKMQVTKIVPGCTHNPPAGSKFCPTCGKPSHKEGWDWVVDPDNSKALPGIVFLTDTDRENFYVCLKAQQPQRHSQSKGGTTVGWVEMADDAVTVARKKLRETLEPLNLWDEKEFGLWSVLYCSY